jgi:hypothetical protein
MHLVTLVQLGGSVDAALGPLADCVGSTAYEVRLLVNAGLPAVVLAVDEAVRAAETVHHHRRLAHAPTAIDRRS